MFAKRLQQSIFFPLQTVNRPLLAALLAAVAFGWPAYSLDPSEIREDDDSEEPAEIEWPEREFPDPKLSADGFNPGERFQFRGQWGIFRKVGQITISTEPSELPDPSYLTVKTEAKTTGLIKAVFPLMLRGHTILDSDGGRIIENRVTDKGRSNEKETITRFDFATGMMNHEDKLRPERNKVRELPYPTPLDYASAILQIRGWDLSKGSRHSLFISSSGKFYLIEMETKGIESLSTQFGRIEAFRVEPVSAFPQSKIFREGGKMAIWVSSDPRRIPLRLDVNTSIGTASMRLESFTLKDTSVLASTVSSAD